MAIFNSYVSLPDSYISHDHPTSSNALCPTLANALAACTARKVPDLGENGWEIPWLLAEAEMMVDDDQWLMMVNDYV